MLKKNKFTWTRVHNRRTRMFPTFFDDMFTSFDNLVNDNRLSFGEMFPPSNVYTKENKDCVIELALAGYKKENLKVSVDKDIVTIESLTKTPEKKDTNHYISHRVKTTDFVRKYSVPSIDYDIASLSVKFVDGLLIVTIPHRKEEKQLAKTIEIM